MSKYSPNLNPFAAALGVSLAAAAAPGIAQSSDNPFYSAEMPSGYMVTETAEGKCGEGKCGGKKETEGKCGEGKCGGKKETEGKCGEGKCGGKKETEGKCGEGKCGGRE